VLKKKNIKNIKNIKSAKNIEGHTYCFEYEFTLNFVQNPWILMDFEQKCKGTPQEFCSKSLDFSGF